MSDTRIERHIVHQPRAMQSKAKLSPKKNCSKVADAIFATMGQVRSGTDTLCKLFKITVAVLTGVGGFVANKALNLAVGKLDNTLDYAETIEGIVTDIDSLVARRIVRDDKRRPLYNKHGYEVRSTAFVHSWKTEPAKAVFRTGIIAANIGGLALWLDAFKVINLKNIANKIIEKFPSFSTIVAKVSLGNVVRGLVAFSFTFLGIDAVIRLCQKKSNKTIAALDLARSVAEVALKVFLIAGGVAFIGGPIGILVGAGLAVIASGIGLSADIYKMVRDRNLKKSEANSRNTAAAA